MFDVKVQNEMLAANCMTRGVPVPISPVAFAVVVMVPKSRGAFAQSSIAGTANALGLNRCLMDRLAE